jgi:hypothetical protein
MTGAEGAHGFRGSGVLSACRLSQQLLALYPAPHLEGSPQLPTFARLLPLVLWIPTSTSLGTESLPLPQTQSWCPSVPETPKYTWFWVQWLHPNHVCLNPSLDQGQGLWHSSCSVDVCWKNGKLIQAVRQGSHPVPTSEHDNTHRGQRLMGLPSCTLHCHTEMSPQTGTTFAHLHILVSMQQLAWTRYMFKPVFPNQDTFGILSRTTFNCVRKHPVCRKFCCPYPCPLDNICIPRIILTTTHTHTHTHTHLQKS